MTTRAIQCPACRAADTSAPDAHGAHTCSYCGVRYHVAVPNVTGQPVMVVGPGNRSSTSVVVLATVVVLLVIGAVLGWLLLSEEPDPAIAAAPAEARATAASEPRSRPAAVTTRVGPAAEPEPVVPATAEFELHGTRASVKDTFYVLGFVTNTSPFTIGKPKLTVALLDDVGNEVGTANGFAEADVLEPGERAPASVIVKDPPAHVSFAVEVSPRRANWIPPEVSGLELESNEAQRGSFGSSFEISGRVHHRGTQPAKFVRVQVLGFDANDKLMGVYFTYADAERLEPGSSARFASRSMFFDGEPARFELQVRGRTAD